MEKEILYRFFNGTATVGEETQVLDWGDADPAHRRQLLAERRIFDAMLMHADTHPVAAERRRRVFGLPKWAREVIKYAAVVLVVVGIGTFFVSRTYDRLLLAGNTISVPVGQRVDVVLPDGTKVCMNARSELKYPAYFIGKTRKVELSGEAFFEVVHDAKRPFIVETFACNVEVLGTKFDVEARPASGEFVTALVEGRVRVTDRATHQGVVLSPNEQATYADGQLLVSRIPDSEDFLWREGILSFRDASFADLLSEFEKYYGITIVGGGRVMSKALLTGKIRISEGVDHAFRVLQRSIDFRYKRSTTDDVIYIQ